VCDENRKYFKVTDKLKPIITTQPMELIEFDHCGPFVKTKNDNNYVLSVIDHFTRKRWFIPTKSTTAEETIHRFIYNVFCPFGFPRVILTDQGSGFTSKLMKELMLITNIKPEFALPRQHNTMGSVENSNKIMEEIVRKYVDRDQETWDELVKFAAYALNNTKSAAHGFTPDYLFFGRKEINPYAENEQVIVNEEIKYEDYANKIKKRLEKSFKIANENLIRYRNEMIKYYDKKRKGFITSVIL